MSKRKLRCLPRINYHEVEEPDLDEYVFCEECGDYVYEYCSIHGPLLVIPDDKVPSPTGFPPCVPRAALTIPHEFLHLAHSTIPGAGLGVFATLTLPRGVRFGPYKGERLPEPKSEYSWQIYDYSSGKRRPSCVVDAGSADRSNWLRYVNCSRHCAEQNLVAYQYQGELYYRTTKIIPRMTELMVFYGAEFARALHVNLKLYNTLLGYELLRGATLANQLEVNNNEPTEKTSTEKQQTTEHATPQVHSQSPDNDASNLVQTKTQAKDIKCKTIENKNIKLGNITTKKTKRNSSATTNILQKKSKWLPANPMQRTDDKTAKNTENQNCKIQDIEDSKQVNTKKKFKRPSAITSNVLVKKSKLLAVHSAQSADSKSNKHFNTEPQVKAIDNTDSKQDTNIKNFIGSAANNPLLTKKSDLPPSNPTQDKNNNSVQIFRCDSCTYVTTEKSKLITHVNTHIKDRPFACEICNKRFTHNSHLNTHVRIHGGIKPYSCEYCERRFTRKYNLNTHIRIHSGIKPYSCEYCERRFTDKGNLNKHIRIHSGIKPYTCEVCQRKFTQKGDLNKHIKIHTGIKPYCCEYCERRFTQKGDLNTHIRIHSGIKPYTCEVCLRKFTQKSNLNTHIKTHRNKINK